MLAHEVNFLAEASKKGLGLSPTLSDVALGPSGGQGGNPCLSFSANTAPTLIAMICVRRWLARVMRSILSERTEDKRVEVCMTRAYVQLGLMPVDADAARMLQLVRFGDYEVRLIEFPQEPRADTPLFWLELYDHDAQIGVDACSCHDLEQGVLRAEHLIAEARRLCDSACTVHYSPGNGGSA